MRCCLTAAPALLTAAASASLRRRTASWRPPHPDAVAAVHLELVTLTEDSAVFTWYTGVPGTDDGTGAMVMLTLTVTGLAADRRGPATVRRVLPVAAMFAGALVGGLLQIRHGNAVALAPALVLLAAVALAAVPGSRE